MIKHINKTKHDFFLGEWKVKRSISDKMNSKFFSFFGEATLVEDLRLNIFGKKMKNYGKYTFLIKTIFFIILMFSKLVKIFHINAIRIIILEKKL